MISGTRLDIRTETVGPAHDPYGRMTITVQRFGTVFEYVSCGLAGESVIVDDVALIENEYEGKADRKFEELTGARPDQWDNWYYSRVYVEDPMGPASMYI